MRKTFAALVAIMLAAAPAMAQGHHGARADSSRSMGMMQGQSGMMQGMHGQQGMMGGMMGMAAGPGMILQLRESLELTEDQVTQLEMLRDSAQSTMRQHMMQGMQVMRTASEQLDSDSPDVDAYEARLREASNHMVLAHTSMARAAVEARQVLTPEQRERLSFARQMMHEMHPGMMGGGMMDRGMIDRGMMDEGMMNQGGGTSPGR